MSNENPNTEGIIKHAKLKTEKTIQKVEEAIKKMIKKQIKINFNSVSAESGVSKAFLYRNTELRERIETLRNQQEGLPSIKQAKRNMSDASKDVIISSLRKRIKDLEKENKEIKEQMKIKFGKIYEGI
ncbi:transposase [Cytobacillus firmus]|uniref:Transposase n=4 Tax=Bacillaceae TaxID=186817 RepID=A0A3S0KFA1_9BACI|nr:MULTISPECIES: DUF6262 family protein [Bacillaceae]KAF0821923.1 hypothetical protein KIS1582_4319 [Cytobacillus firmus]MBG9543220.1 transposase [Cytobacillus firmus]MBG9551712.1 transposase [Cytobacillus firmus]MBG9557315.1 transposase [Cytobacillus firmus]MBG9574744.1 transposase [Cytobacillus firmus]